MVGVKKFCALAAITVFAATGTVATVQPVDASHAHNLLVHHGLVERHPELQKQNQPSLLKVQKRLGPLIGDGLGGLVNGLGEGLGFAGKYFHLPNFARKRWPSRWLSNGRLD